MYTLLLTRYFIGCWITKGKIIKYCLTVSVSLSYRCVSGRVSLKNAIDWLRCVMLNDIYKYASWQF